MRHVILITCYSNKVLNISTIYFSTLLNSSFESLAAGEVKQKVQAIL